MAVKIRLARIGRKNLPKYRVVAIEEGKKRNGRYIEKIGNYDPLSSGDPLAIDVEKLKKWLSVGAIVSHGARRILRKLL